MSERIVIETTDEAIEHARSRPRLPMVVSVLALMVAAGFLFGTRGPDAAQPTQISVPVEPFRPPSGPWSELEFTGDGGFTDVVEGPTGMVAVGSGRRVDSAPFAFHTEDGLTWTPVEGPWVFGEVITSVAVTDTGYLAAGYRLGSVEGGDLEDAEPRVWSSTDGRSFAALDTTGLPALGVIGDLAFADGTITAVGWAGPARLEPLRAPGPTTTGHVWVTSDGLAWSEATPETDDAWFTEVLATDHGVVLAGATGAQATVWIPDSTGGWRLTSAPGPDVQPEVTIAVAEREAGYVAITRSRQDVEGLASVWAVGTNGFWQPLDGNGRPNAAAWIEPVGRGLLAGAGFTRSIYPEGPELWASEGGVDWEGVEITSGSSPWPPTIVTEVSEFGDLLLAFGSRGGRPAGWALLEG